MILTESCGCGASITLEHDQATEGVTVGIRRSLIDEFRTLHMQCRTDERARVVAEAYVPAPATTSIFNYGTPDGWPNPDGPWVWGEQDERGETAVGPPITAPAPTGPMAACRTDRAEWPYTSPMTGYTYEAPTTVDELARTHETAAQASMENWREDEHPPNPTWNMVGLLWRELEALSRLVAETMAAGDTGSEYHALHDLIGVAEGRTAEVLPADVGVEARTLRRIGELRHLAVARIEAERDAD